MVLVSPSLNPVACWEFEGEILVLHHPTTISARYQAMGKTCNVVTASYKGAIILTVFLVHCGSIRQTASIVSMSTDCLRTGDR